MSDQYEATPLMNDKELHGYAEKVAEMVDPETGKLTAEGQVFVSEKVPVAEDQDKVLSLVQDLIAAAQVDVCDAPVADEAIAEEAARNPA